MRDDLEAAIIELAERPVRSDDSLGRLEELRAALNAGRARVVEGEEDDWRLNAWVKRGILLHVLLGGLREVAGSRGGFWELDTLPPRKFSAADGVRAVPGSLIRDGAAIGAGSVILSGCSIAIGASLGRECQLDSGCTVGLCATLGNGVCLEAGSRVGGVLNPAERYPAIVGDGCVLGMGSAVTGSVVLGPHSVIAPGVQLTDVAGVWNNLAGVWIRPDARGRLILPDRAVIVSGSAPLGGSSHLLVPLVIGLAERDEPASAAFRRIVSTHAQRLSPPLCEAL